jgi:hypothetical protein
MVDVITVVPGFAAVNDGTLPVPPGELKPVEVFEFVQVNVTPGIELLNVDPETKSPTQ